MLLLTSLVEPVLRFLQGRDPSLALSEFQASSAPAIKQALTGAPKADAVAAMVEGPITADLPASVLQMHPVCRLVIDQAAAARLKRADYYRWVYQNNPEWQR